MLCFSTTNVEVNILPCEENKKIQVVVMVKFGLGDEFLSFSDTSDAKKKNRTKTHSCQLHVLHRTIICCDACSFTPATIVKQW